MLQQKDLEITRVKGRQYFNTVTQHVKDEIGRREHCDEVLTKCEEEIKLLENLMVELKLQLQFLKNKMCLK